MMREGRRKRARKIGGPFHGSLLNPITKSNAGKLAKGTWQVIWGELLTGVENGQMGEDGALC